MAPPSEAAGVAPPSEAAGVAPPTVSPLGSEAAGGEHDRGSRNRWAAKNEFEIFLKEDENENKGT